MRKTSKQKGRPRSNNPATARLPNIRVTPDKLREYRDKARQEGVTFSEWVRTALERALKRSRPE
jgi:predicted DNA binding CopG/RHH family protein